MRFRRALVGAGTGVYELTHTAPIPVLQPDEMLCQTIAVSLNPADAKKIDHSPNPGVGGYDFSGTVTEVGDAVTRFKPGDEIFGFVHGLHAGNKHSGAFTDIVVATADLCCKVPPTMTAEQASTLALALGTVGFGLFAQLGLAMPGADVGERPEFVLVAGGNTASGRMAIQLLKLSGIKPIVTCSASARETLLGLGASEALDYGSRTCGREIKNLTGNTLTHALDCVSSAETMAMCFEALGAKGGTYIGLEAPSTPIKYTRRDVTVDWVQALSLFGQAVKLDGVYGRPASPAHRQWAAKFYRSAETWVRDSFLTCPPTDVRDGGLQGVIQGVDEVRKGLVRGRKLVYPIA